MSAGHHFLKGEYGSEQWMIAIHGQVFATGLKQKLSDLTSLNTNLNS